MENIFTFGAVILSYFESQVFSEIVFLACGTWGASLSYLAEHPSSKAIYGDGPETANWKRKDFVDMGGRLVGVRGFG